MNKLYILLLLTMVLVGCGENYSKCPTAPYGEHSFSTTIVHETYWWQECDYCGLEIREVFDSDFLQVKNPHTGDLVKMRKDMMYPKYKNQHELENK